jgi:anti-anti-sigma regulatory factor
MNSTQFQVTRNCATLLLPRDFGGSDALEIRNSLLESLHRLPKINGVVLDCSNLTLIDRLDLQQLLDIVHCIRLMGKKIGFCSIGASLAAVLVNLNAELSDCCFGINLDDTLRKLEA